MELCTVFRMFEVTMDSVPAEGRIIISVIENFIEKEINQVDDTEKEERMKAMMSDFMKVVVKAAKKNKGAKFVMAYETRTPLDDRQRRHDQEGVRGSVQQAGPGQHLEG